MHGKLYHFFSSFLLVAASEKSISSGQMTLRWYQFWLQSFFKGPLANTASQISKVVCLVIWDQKITNLNYSCGRPKRVISDHWSLIWTNLVEDNKAMIETKYKLRALWVQQQHFKSFSFIGLCKKWSHELDLFWLQGNKFN